MTTGNPLAWLNSSEGRLQVSELVVGVVRKARLTPGHIATERRWEATTFCDEVTRVDPESEFSLDGFGDPGDREERRVTASSQDSEDGSGMDSSVLGKPRGSFE